MSQEGKYQNSPDTEVISKPQRRRYTAEYKLRMLQEYDACEQPGEKGAYEKNPERFVKGMPTAPQLPEAVWINPPKKAPTQGTEDPMKTIELKQFDLREPIPEAGALSRVVRDWNKKDLHPPLTGWPEEYNCQQGVLQLDEKLRF